ncbi:MAG: aldehyde dehydrogenase family protein [Acidobacteriota bacterium]|nr:aldehyde dehydrogenase family protein [Acidobacteriota bacterium]
MRHERRADDGAWLPPIDPPSKIIGVHLSYRSRCVEYQMERIPEVPSYFMKPTSSLSAHEAPVARPRGCRFLNYEGEFAVVIGRRATGVAIEEALDYVRGYTLVNDFGIHDFRHADRGSMLRVKGQDGFGPMGPALVDAGDVDPNDLTLRTLVNGEVVQEGNTGEDLLFSFAYQVADLSRLITLEPGDVIMTGTPANSRPVEPATWSRCSATRSARSATRSSSWTGTCEYAVSRLAEAPRTLHGGERTTVRHDPAGVVAVSTPWNAPFMLATWRVGPALAAGNTVVLKPPEWAPLTCSLLGDLAEEAGLPPGVLNIVHGGPETGALLTGHAGVDRIAFTGSPATARTVGAAAAAELTPVSFELGGKSPFLVFADADLEAAARTAAYQYDNSGQVCLAGTRLLVERSCLDAFMERFLAEVEAIRVVDPRDAETTYGPLIHPRALARVEAHVEKALAQGAALRFGGEGSGGLYYPPTLFADVPPGADILREEVFGPVLTLQAFEDDDEAIALAESTDYGLAAMIFTGDEARAGRLSRRISAGTIWVNCFYVRDLETPFGGTKHSGIGREGGRHSFDFYCDVKTVCERTAAFAATGTGGGS